ncbi:MAG: ATP-binding protein [Planctomycetes bacterium]|nr:ATP-binding protein [Planctomycetota bacterium]
MLFGRWIEPVWRKKLATPYVHLVFGARQTGKSTLLRQVLPEPAVWIDLARPAERSEFLRDPDRLVGLCRALPTSEGPTVVVVDEAQNVPALFDAVQHLYDSDKQRWRFVLCGSSARKLRRTGANLLPGRSFLHHLYPLVLAERPVPAGETSTLRVDPPLPLSAPAGSAPASARGRPRPPPASPHFPPSPLVERLLFGDLPGVATAGPEDRPDLLRAYAMVHLEEELRREALIKDWGAFARFLQLAAAESGHILNYSALSQEAGVSVPTIKNYYQLLEDMFLGFRVTAFSGSPRKNLLSTERFLFFDLGVRNATARLPLSPDAVSANPGPLFEQWVGIELWKRLGYLESGRLNYFRTKAGAEVDFIVERDGRYIPIEVKWTDHPTHADARHLLAFLEDHPKAAAHGYVICRTSVPLEIADRVTALPWSCL